MNITRIKKGIVKTKITILGISFSIKHNYEKSIAGNYVRKLAQLQEIFGKQKIRVGFLVSEQAKWQYQSLYEELEQSSCFEPVVLVTQLISAHNLERKNKKNFHKTIEDCYNFFKSKNLNVQYAYDLRKKTYIPPKNFDIDILFYQQPWDLDDSQHPANVSKSALTCHVSYGMQFTDCDHIYTKHFHKLLWMMFVENEQLIKNFSRLIKAPVTNCAAVGYPKLDAYLNSHNKHDLKFPSPGTHCSFYIAK